MQKNKQGNERPTPKQFEFLSWEFGLFFHFGIRSCYPGHQDFDGKHMDLSAFNPRHLDCDAWAKAAVQAGARYCVLTAKHHDGFALWPTAHSPYSVKNTPYQSGKGDVVAQFVDACRANNLKVGIYYSPAQWGAGPEFVPGPAYDDYFIAQITELLTNYGTIDYLWFDAEGSANHRYDKKRIIAAIRKLQKDILIFNLWDPDTLWAGNESGYTGLANFNVRKILNAEQLLVENNESSGTYRRFLPLECDTKIRSTWYDDDNVHTIKSLQELMGMYENSVGRGANLLLNIGPDKQGRLPKPDAIRLQEFGAAIRHCYGKALAFAPKKDEDSFTLVADEALLVDRLVLQENIIEGQHIQSFKIYAHMNEKNVLLIYQGQSIGHKHICAIPPIRAQKFTVETQPPRAVQSIYSFFAHNTQAE